MVFTVQKPFFTPNKTLLNHFFILSFRNNFEYITKNQYFI